MDRELILESSQLAESCTAAEPSQKLAESHLNKRQEVDQKHTSQRPAQTNIHAMGKSSTGPVVRYLIKKYEFNYKR